MKLYIPTPIRKLRSNILDDVNSNVSKIHFISHINNNLDNNKCNYIIIPSPKNLSLQSTPNELLNNKDENINQSLYFKNKKIFNPVLFNDNTIADFYINKYKTPLSPTFALTNDIIKYKNKKNKYLYLLNNNKMLNKLKKYNLLKKGIDIIKHNINRVNSERITFNEKKDYKNILKKYKYSRLNHIYYLCDNNINSYVICKKKYNKYINYIYVKDFNDLFQCNIIKLRFFYILSFIKINNILFYQ